MKIDGRPRQFSFRLRVLLRLIGFLGVFILFVAGCGESGLLDFYNIDGSLEVQSIPAGTVLKPGEAIPLSVASGDSNGDAERFEVQLFSRDGEELGKWTIPVRDVPGQLDTDNLSRGFYRLDIRLLDRSGRELSSSELPFFIDEDPSRIKGISAYPSAALPREGMIFFADLELSAGSDPFIRWRASGREIASGRVSEGAQLISWRVPETEGVYPVTAELFPVDPPESEIFSFPGTERLKIEAFVSTDPEVPRGELGPGSSFSALFHFRGTFDSRGYLNLAEPTLTGSPHLAVEGGLFGYRFGPEDSLQFSHSLLPSDSPAAPFTIEVKGLFLGTGPLFTARDRRMNEVLSLSRVDEGFALLLEGSHLLMPFPEEILSSPRFLALSLDPRSGKTGVRWFLDGEFAGAAELPLVELPADGSQGSASIGGGFSGLLDEFGIYTRNSQGSPGADDALFAYAMRESYGRLLVMAEGFDSLSTPSSQRDGSLFLSGSGEITVEPGQSSAIIPAGGRAGIGIPYAEFPDGRIRFKLGDLSAGVTVQFIIAGNESRPVELIPELDGTVNIVWRRIAASVELSTEGATLARFDETGEGQDLECWLTAPAGEILLDWILISRGEARIAAQVEGEDPSPGA